jgi:hypothetical protein
MKKAKVNVLQTREVENNNVIVTEVEIAGYKTKRSFVIEKNASENEIKNMIQKQLNAEQNRKVINSFEVEIDGD